MAKVILEFFDIKITIEDKNTSYHKLLNTASKGIVDLVDNINIKSIIDKAMSSNTNDGTDEDAQISLKKEEIIFR